MAASRLRAVIANENTTPPVRSRARHRLARQLQDAGETPQAIDVIQADVDDRRGDREQRESSHQALEDLRQRLLAQRAARLSTDLDLVGDTGSLSATLQSGHLRADKRGRLRDRLAELYVEDNDPSAAIAILEENLLDAEIPVVVRSRARRKLANLRMDAGDHVRAIQLLTQEIEDPRTDADSRSFARQRLAYLADEVGDFSSAIDWLERDLAAPEANSDTRSSTRWVRAEIYREHGELGMAMRSLGEDIADPRTTSDARTWSRHQLADLYAEQGDTQPALDLLAAALPDSFAAGDQYEEHLLNRYIEVGSESAALTMLERTIEDRATAVEVRSWCRRRAALIYDERDDLKSALDALSPDLAEEVKTPYSLGESQWQLARLNARVGDLDAAVAVLETDAGRSPVGQPGVSVRQRLAELYEDVFEDELAAEVLHAEIDDPDTDAVDRSRARRRLARLYDASGDANLGAKLYEDDVADPGTTAVERSTSRWELAEMCLEDTDSYDASAAGRLFQADIEDPRSPVAQRIKSRWALAALRAELEDWREVILVCNGLVSDPGASAHDRRAAASEIAKANAQLAREMEKRDRPPAQRPAKPNPRRRRTNAAPRYR